MATGRAPRPSGPAPARASGSWIAGTWVVACARMRCHQRRGCFDAKALLLGALLATTEACTPSTESAAPERSKGVSVWWTPPDQTRAGASSPSSGDAANAASGSKCASPTVSRDLEGVELVPPDSPWRTPIDDEPVDPKSDEMLVKSACSPDRCAALIAETAVPVNTVCGVEPSVRFEFKYAAESDVGPYPITSLVARPDPAQPLALLQEQGPCPPTGCADGKDHHVLIYNHDDKKLYELYQPYLDAQGRWHAASGAIFDTTSNARRPDGWGSADAAGLPMMPGVLRCDEVANGEVKHALRFTLRQTKPTFVHPATHRTRTRGGAPMGARFRLKAAFDVTPYTKPQRTILNALKKYGMFLADNGTNFGISAEPSEKCWVEMGLTEYPWGSGFFFVSPRTGGKVRGSDFEVVKLGREYDIER